MSDGHSPRCVAIFSPPRVRRGAGDSRRGGEADGQPPRRFAPPLLKKGGESEGRYVAIFSPPRMRRGAGDSRRGGEANGQPPRRFAPPLLKKGGESEGDTWRFFPSSDEEGTNRQ